MSDKIKVNEAIEVLKNKWSSAEERREAEKTIKDALMKLEILTESDKLSHVSVNNNQSIH